LVAAALALPLVVTGARGIRPLALCSVSNFVSVLDVSPSIAFDAVVSTTVDSAGKVGVVTV